MLRFSDGRHGPIIVPLAEGFLKNEVHTHWYKNDKDSEYIGKPAGRLGMVSQTDITEMEYLASQFWPAREIERYKGWIIHFNDGITWRANSVLPIGPINDTRLEDAIEHIITYYCERRTPAAFKITEASKPDDLDETLEEMGFEKRMVTYVQTIPIQELSCVYPRVPVDIIKVDDASIDTLMYESGFDSPAVEARRGIIKRIEGEKGIGKVMIDGRLAGMGLGVVRADWLGLFSIRTLPDYQRRGVAWSISCALGMWGEDLGAKKAFLQAEAKNTPALALYESMGFQIVYSYWYRVLPYSNC
jgi:ribosomal protein S18 acetylase RimI-like enzyme